MVSNFELRNDKYPLQVALKAIKEGLIDNFGQFEECLREVGSKVHFISIPKEACPDLHFYFPYKEDNSQEAEYGLSINIDPNEAADILAKLNLDYKTNIEQLAKSGLALDK